MWSLPRCARLSLAGVSLHIIQRGVCFYAEDDYLFYRYHLGELAERFGCAIHACVMMTNHVHLLLTLARADSAPLLMKHLSQR
jgi:putative transposase